MHEVKYNGEETLSDNKTVDDLALAIQDAKVKSAALHKPGSIVEMSDGKRYEVQKNGCWKKL